MPLPLAAIDMSAETRHLVEVMASILQPLIWLGLCIGFVLASAHLLTMLGTRWGDRRVSSKALFFSVAVHVSLGLGVVLMIPEYRQHILNIGHGDPPEVDVQLVTRDDGAFYGAAREGGEPAAWDRIPQQLPQTIDRAPAAASAAGEPIEAPERPPPVELADRRPVDSTPLPAVPEVLPQPAQRPDARERSPVETPDLTASTGAEARADVGPPQPSVERSAPQFPAAPEAERPLSGVPAELPPTLRREEPIASLAPSPVEAPVRSRVEGDLITRTPTPAPVTLPDAGDEGGGPVTPGSPVDNGSGAPRVTRSRSTAPAGGAGTANNSAGGLGNGRALASAVPSNRFEPGRPGQRGSPGRPGEEGYLAPGGGYGAGGGGGTGDGPSLRRPGAGTGGGIASLPGGQVPAPFRLRTDEEQKDEAIRKFGGTEDSQRAVERAIAWLTSIQQPQGSWDASAFEAGRGPPESDPKIAERRYAGRSSDTGVTALALLAIMANGNSLTEGAHAVSVERGVNWLIARQHDDGSLTGDASQFEAMYCHGIATLALAEAYAMEQDAVARAGVRDALQRALAYTTTAQLSDGGWRYYPRGVVNDTGDMSMFGWQLMALKSAQDGGIPMPETTRAAMIKFLKDRSRGTDGGLAGYRGLDPPTPAMTAEALACKQMLGLRRDNPMAREAVDYLLRHPPRLTTLNLYYWYYGTLALFQHGGDEWTQWNAGVRDVLVSEQLREGPFAGSWEPKDQYSRYGGRIFSTAVATLCLEVYYRRLPMYQSGGTAAAP